MSTGLAPLDALVHVGANTFNWAVGTLHHDVVMTYITRDTNLGPSITTLIAASIIALGGTALMWPCIWGFGEYLEARSAARRRETEAAGEQPLPRRPRRQRCACAREVCGSVCGCGAWASACMGACCAPCKACGGRGAPRALKVREAQAPARPSLSGQAAPTPVWRRVAVPVGAGLRELHTALLSKLRPGEGAQWQVVSCVQVPAAVLVEDDDDVGGLGAGDALEVTLVKQESKKAQ